MKTYNEKVNKLIEVFSKYYNDYDGKFDEEFLCRGFAKKINPDEKNDISSKFKFHKTLGIKEWMKLIKLVAGTDYNFYDKDLNHYGFTDYSEYETKKKEVEESIGLFDM